MTTTPAQRAGRSLQDVIDAVPNIADHLYNDTPGVHASTRPDLVPIPQEFTNWRDEQRAWGETAVLLNQTHHMPELMVSGPDARRLLSELAVNSLANLRPGIAKQLVACNSAGQVIGDCVLYDHGDERYELISGKTLLNWVQFKAETGDHDVTVERDENTSDNSTGRRWRFRYELDGPNAGAIFDKLVEGGAPEIKFFHTAQVLIDGIEVTALRHSMAGHQGVELSGPFEHDQRIREAILAAGSDYGLKQGGTKAYFTTNLESGWIGYPLPAIYTAEDLRDFREWLPDDGWEAKFQLGGSFRSANIEDYYVTPFDLGYGKIVKFDHDFVGRAALEAIAGQPPRRRVTLAWHDADVEEVFGSMFGDDLPYRYLELPMVSYGMPHNDEVRDTAGNLIGRSTWAGFSTNEHKLLSLGFVDAVMAEPGTEVVVVWGEPDGGSRKPRIERHRQREIRATVGTVPYSKSVGVMKQASVGGGS